MSKKHVIGDYAVLRAPLQGYAIYKLVSLDPSSTSQNNIFWMCASERYAKRSDATRALKKIQTAGK